MKKMCITAYVYGREYQDWIPIYIFSVLTNYPDYHVRIYLDGIMRKDVRESLQHLNYMSNFQIIENCNGKYTRKLGAIENRSLRWLFQDDEILKYEYVYIGDIDIYIVKETPELFIQHLKHMKYTGLPYSNEIRLSLCDFLMNYPDFPRSHLFRLTGLHFVKANQFFPKVKKQQHKLRALLLNGNNKLSMLQKIEKAFLKAFIFKDDERVLWWLVKSSGIRLPRFSYEIAKENPMCFRPHHGLHFAIGRDIKSYRQILKRDALHGNGRKEEEFKKYFESFVSDYNKYPLLRELIWNYGRYSKKIIYDTCDYFGYSMSEKFICQRNYKNYY